MLDSDFWHELADKFRALDTHGRYLWASWSADLSNGVAGPTHWALMTEGDVGHNAKVLFEPLATRAAARLGKTGNLTEAWLEELKSFHGGDHSGSGLNTASDGTKTEHIGGTIMRLCQVSAEFCNSLETSALQNARQAPIVILRPANELAAIPVRPLAHLSEIEWEQVASDQYELDKKSWPEIVAMKQMPIAIALSEGIFGPPHPPRPKLKIKLFELLGSYAVGLFGCEYKQYPDAHKYEWAAELVEKTVRLVANKITLMEKGFPGLNYHAPYDQMLAAVRTVLNENLKKLPKPILPLVMLPIPAPQVPIEKSSSTNLSVSDQLKSLFEESGISVRVAATALVIKPKSVYRHIHGEAVPREGHINGYEKLFSDHFKRAIQIKSHKKVTLKSKKSHTV